MEHSPQLRSPRLSCSEITSQLKEAERKVESGDSEGSIQILLRLNTLVPQDLAVVLNLGHNYSLLKNFDLAWTCYMKVVQEGSGKLLEEAWFGLASLFYKQKNFSDAENAFKYVLALNPNFEYISTVYLKLGIITKNNGNIDEAIVYFQACSRVKGLSQKQIFEVLLQLAYCFEIVGNLKNSFLMINESIKLKKKFRNSAALAWIFSKQGKFDKAINLVKEFAQHSKMKAKENKYFYDAQFLLALVMNKARNFEAAEKNFKSLLENFPENPYYNAGYGALLGNLGKFFESLAHLSKSLGYLPENTQFLRTIGLVYENMGAFDQCYFANMKILQIKPSDSFARLKIRQIQTGEIQTSPNLIEIWIDITEFPPKVLETFQSPNITVPRPIYPSKPESPFLLRNPYRNFY